MGYYIRVLGTKDPDIHIDELLNALKEDGLEALVNFDKNETPDKWTVIQIVNDKGQELTQIERNPVIDGELGKEELDEFKKLILDYKPISAVNWLTNYFSKVKVIYAFQILNAGFEDSNFDIISALKTKIWNKTEGILQADNEGFTNDDGYHILWQFPDNVTGDWSCATINQSGQWQNFIMDLGDTTQREEFQNGKVPKNAKQITEKRAE
jgi:hypothetical protein